MAPSKSIDSLLVLAVASLFTCSLACGDGDDRQGGSDTSVSETETSVETEDGTAGEADGETAPDTVPETGGEVDAESEVDGESETTPEPIAIVTTSLPEGEAGLDYGPFALEARGGEPPYTWAITGGDEPRSDFLDPEAGELAGLLAVAGDFALTFVVTDAAGESAERTLTLTVNAPPAFDSTIDPPFSAGEHWLGDFIVRAGDVVTLDDGTTLNVIGALTIEAGGRLEVADCGSLTINHLSRSAPAEILGELDNRCADEAELGGDLVLRSVGALVLGGDDEGLPGLVASSGELFIGDPWYRARPEPEVLSYVATVEPEEAPPVCAVRIEQAFDAITATLPLDLSLAVAHDDPDGGASSVVAIDWGDATVDEAPTSFSHTYTEPGLHEVLVTVADDEGQTCTASLTIHIPEAPVDEEAPAAVAAFRGPSSVWAVTDDFDGTALVHPVGVPFTLASQRSDPDASAVFYVDGEALPCPPGEVECTVAAAVSSPGVHEIVFVTESADGERTQARLTIFAPLEGGETEHTDPPAPELPFPEVPPSWAPAPEPRSARDKSHGTTCADCALCTDPAATTGPVVRLGSAELRAWGSGGAIIIGLSTGTIVINPTLVFTSSPGANGAPGQDGKSSRGFAAASYAGKVVLCGGTFNGARGGHGGDDPGPMPNGVVRGGNGAPWFGVLFSAPEGTISYCGDLTVRGADGGDGGDADNDVDAIGPGAACENADSATAIGGRGGLGGGGIAYLAEEVCFDDAYTITFGCRGGTCLGGAGGEATALGQTPAPCADCDEYAGRGGDASAVGGRGGRSVWYFVTRPDLAPDPEVYVDHLFPIGTYRGGAGGDGDATAGDGGDSTCNGCNVEYSWAGRGGYAYATGGRASFGLSGRGAGGDADASSGAGGDATSTPNPAVAPGGCPGQRGCTLYGFGGRSGIARAWPGEGSPDGVQTLFSGVGGDATVTGGQGGPGVGCPDCDGGRGGKAVAVAGRDPQGLPIRVDGTATATGGQGGNGSTCCAPPEKGGDGGDGGDGISRTGPAGANALRGGNGGNGGDGEPPGGAGDEGLGIGTPVDIPDGLPGAPGKDCPGAVVCPDPGPDCCNVDADCGVPPECVAYRCVDHACISQLLTGDPCDDGDVCSEEDHCVEGVCMGTPIDCDDDIACTLDHCVADGNAPRCQHTPNDDLCGQGDACVERFCDPNQGCVEVPESCDDDDVCTIDDCDPETGCTHQAITCPAAPICQQAICDPQEGCGTANLPDGTACGDGVICSQGQCVPRLSRVISDCWVLSSPGQVIDVTTWVSGGAGATTVSLVGGSPSYTQAFTLTGTTLTVKATSPEGFGGDLAARVRIQRGAEVIEILVVARFPDPGGAQGAVLTGTDGNGPTAPITDLVELTSQSPPFEGFLQADGAGWVCDESSCSWCWASSLSISASVANMVIGGHCDPGCGASQACLIEGGNPVCRNVDSAQSATCQAQGTGNVFIVGSGCRWRSLGFDDLYIDPLASTNPGSHLVDVGAPFTVGPVPAQNGCGFIAFRYRFTASPPLGCFERLQAGGSDVLGLDVLVILK